MQKLIGLTASVLYIHCHVPLVLLILEFISLDEVPTGVPTGLGLVAVSTELPTGLVSSGIRPTIL